MIAEYMRLALDLAREGVGRTSPNPAVGAVVVRDGRVAGRGYHTWAGLKHAEIIALDEAGGEARGADLYVSLEPCCHDGRTGPCTEAIVRAGIARVFAAMQDPNGKVCGQGFVRLREAGIEVAIAREFTTEAEALNEPFVHYMRTGRPLVTLKAAVTLDGKISAPDDNEGWITSERARADVQRMRYESDAIMTGIGTVLADDCLLTDRSGRERSRPLLRVVVDSQLRLPVHSKIVTSADGDVVVATTTAAPAERRAALERRGIRIWTLNGRGGRVDLRSVVETLAREQRLSLMIEAGSKLNWAVLDAGIADKIYFYYAPKLLGGIESLPVAGGTGRRSRRDAIRLSNVRLHPIPPDEFAVEAWFQR